MNSSSADILCPLKVIWLHERSEGLKFFEVLRSLSMLVWRLSGRQMSRCAQGKNISWVGLHRLDTAHISSSCV